MSFAPSPPPLAVIIKQALTVKESAREGLVAISDYPECSQRLRKRTYDLDLKIGANEFVAADTARELEAILKQVDHWIKVGTENVHVWNEGCPHEGWLEPCVPINLHELNTSCKPLRHFLSAIWDALNTVTAAEITERLQM